MAHGLGALKDALKLPLLFWFVMVLVPSIIIYVMVATESLLPGFVILGLALYPMYRVMKKNEDAQAQAGENKVFLNEQQVKDTVDYLKRAKEKRDQHASEES
jgi:hypothetical protein